jgi:hypothetical protein
MDAANKINILPRPGIEPKAIHSAARRYPETPICLNDRQA